MTLTHHVGDIFAHPTLSKDPRSRYVQCISADLAMGKGVAVEFNRELNTKKMVTEYVKGTYPASVGDVIRAGRVYNMVTKQNYWNKPTMGTFSGALANLRILCEEEGTTILLMPLIGCGLDRLRWTNVEKVIRDEFRKMAIEIHVFTLEKDRKLNPNL